MPLLHQGCQRIGPPLTIISLSPSYPGRKFRTDNTVGKNNLLLFPFLHTTNCDSFAKLTIECGPEGVIWLYPEIVKTWNAEQASRLSTCEQFPQNFHNINHLPVAALMPALSSRAFCANSTSFCSFLSLSLCASFFSNWALISTASRAWCQCMRTN